MICCRPGCHRFDDPKGMPLPVDALALWKQNQSPPNQKVTCSYHDISEQNCLIDVNQQLLIHSSTQPITP
jgi:Zn ribbon nucleic-acid-binding protein